MTATFGAGLITCAASGIVLAVVIVTLIRLRKSRTPSKVMLLYRSGTTVTLEASEVKQRTARGSSPPPMRRRLPGLMPTAGHVVVPKRAVNRPATAKMEFDVT